MWKHCCVHGRTLTYNPLVEKQTPLHLYPAFEELIDRNMFKNPVILKEFFIEEREKKRQIFLHNNFIIQIRFKLAGLDS